MAKLFELGSGVELTSLNGDYGFYTVTKDGTGTPADSRFVSLQTLADWMYINKSAVPAGVAQSSLRLQLTSDKAVGTSSDYLAWDTIQEDTSNGELSWVIGTPSRVTIGAGVTRVQVSMSLFWDSSDAAGTRTMFLRKNGVSFDGQVRSTVYKGLSWHTVSTGSCEIAVSPGDYLELRGSAETASSISARTDTWMQVRVTERT